MCIMSKGENVAKSVRDVGGVKSLGGVRGVRC